MTTPSDAPPAWCGWHRAPGRPWRKVLEAASEEAAWSELLARRLDGDLTVCRGDADPNAPTGGKYRAGGRRLL